VVVANFKGLGCADRAAGHPARSTSATHLDSRTR
jgi:hypothetical protein